MPSDPALPTAENDVAMIRAAAAFLREPMPPGQYLRDLFDCLAEWLDTAGADLWAHGPLCECGSGCLDCDDDPWQPHVRRALATARAVLAGRVTPPRVTDSEPTP